MEDIRKHFEEEAVEFDNIIIRLIPFYSRMVQSLVDSIPFDRNDRISVLDLGCGTGTVAKAVADKFRNANINCVDIAENMLEMAKIKLKDYPATKFIQSDFNKIRFSQNYDVVVSSLAIHHLTSKEDKIAFYSKIYNCLNENGCFFNADVVLASNEKIQKVYIERWTEYMLKSEDEKNIINKWLPTYYKEDNPEKMNDQIKWLEEIGFSTIDVIWKYYNFAVYGGYK